LMSLGGSSFFPLGVPAQGLPPLISHSAFSPQAADSGKASTPLGGRRSRYFRSPKSQETTTNGTQKLPLPGM
jgi:hypothetical protein